MTISTQAQAGSYQAARLVCRKWQPGLFFACHFLSKTQRFAIYCLTALAQQLEQIADPSGTVIKDVPGGTASDAQAMNPCASDCSTNAPCGGRESSQQRRAVCLAVLDHLYAGRPTGKPELDSFRDVAAAYAVPRSYWERLVDGLIDRAVVRRYATWARLRSQLHDTAAMGAMFAACVWAWERDGRGASDQLDRACAFGIGVGLTSVLADFCNHWTRGRLMIPLDDLVRFKLSEREMGEFVAAGTCAGDERVLDLMSFEVRRARSLIRGGLKRINTMPEASHRRALWALSAHYTSLLDRVEHAGVFAAPVRVSTWERLRGLPRMIRAVRAVG